MLTLRNISYRYAGTNKAVLSGVNLSIADGEAVGLVGASEGGKTTLCLVASGLAPRSIGGILEGALLVDDRDVRELPMHEMAPMVGICFQNPHTQLSQVAETVFEEIAFGSMNLGLDRLDVAARTTDAMEALGIIDLAERDPRQLSGGQMQLVAVAGLLAMRPGHLVLDEPTAQLDPEGTHLVGEALAGIVSRGTGLLIAEHDTDLLASLCSRVVALDAGAVVMDGPATDVLGDKRLADLGVVPPSRVRLSRSLETAGVLDVALP
ncbi:MAG TPA: ABC transporter ATP-binding protein [Candidatus Limnocylindrales bacterium]|nr:ABC transporter ATP-binding protein [Candidatus Limnocylindrales bacterium]